MTTPAQPWLAPRGRIFDNLALVIGGTPMIRLHRMMPDNGCEIFLKLESENPLKSVKDRLARALIEAGERDGHITPGTHIIEATSGNTGIALAFICAIRGYRLTLTMPESMSIERRALLRQYGANLVLTPAELGAKGAVDRAQELTDNPPDDAPVFLTAQFDNPANPAIHEHTTGPEIWADSGNRVDAVVAGVGTGGTITGVTDSYEPRIPTCTHTPSNQKIRRSSRVANPGRTKSRASAPVLSRRTSMSPCSPPSNKSPTTTRSLPRAISHTKRASSAASAPAQMSAPPSVSRPDRNSPASASSPSRAHSVSDISPPRSSTVREKSRSTERTYRCRYAPRTLHARDQ